MFKENFTSKAVGTLTLCMFGLTAILVIPNMALSGNLEATANPTDAASAMHTTDNLYDRLTTGAAGGKRTGAFVEPTNGPVDGVGRSLDEIMLAAPAEDNLNGAVPGEVASGKTFWGLRTDGTWGPQSGTVPSKSLDSNSTTVNAGIYSATDLATEDPDLVSDNIKGGVAIFGVPGNSNVVDLREEPNLTAGNIKGGVTILGVSGDLNVADTSTGDATAADIAINHKAWVDGSEITGTANDCSNTCTDDNGGNCYLSQGAKSTLDPDLTASNIKSGETIFGVTGTLTVKCMHVGCIDTSYARTLDYIQAAANLSYSCPCVPWPNSTTEPGLHCSMQMKYGEIQCFSPSGGEIPAACKCWIE